MSGMAQELDQVLGRRDIEGDAAAGSTVEVPLSADQLEALITGAVARGVLVALEEHERRTLKRKLAALTIAADMPDEDADTVPPDAVADVPFAFAVAQIARETDRMILHGHLVRELAGGNRAGVVSALEVRLQEVEA